jgi:hypothetical protein
MATNLSAVYAPGTRVVLDMSEYGIFRGTVTVCLCKRHKWQAELPGGAGPGRECGHARGFRVDPAECPWPMHVMWDNGDESHQGMAGLSLEAVLFLDQESALTRPVPFYSGEGAIYTPEYLRHREGNARGTEPHMWRFFSCSF